jgi:lipopolysaccharide transport system ATP-binding protein
VTRDVVLAAEAVSKRFRSVRWRPMLKETLLQRLSPGPRPSHEYTWALRDVSFSVLRGDAFGIIGHNGAGKSTLLRLLCGVGLPTSGRVARHGHVHGLLELGSGFHGDLTGRENLRTGGILSGFTEREVREREAAIVAFAELEEVIDQPVRTYSNGMYLRLAFATATHFDPDVLVVDEVLAVGDARFQQKCLERLRAFRAGGGTLVITSHVPQHFEALCREVLVLEEGRVVMSGDPAEAMRRYDDLLVERTRRRTALDRAHGTELSSGSGLRHGSQDATITAVRLRDAGGRDTDAVRSGDELVIELDVTQGRSVEDLALTIAIHAGATKVFETSIPSVATALGHLGARATIRCRFPRVPLLPAHYWVNVGVYPCDGSLVYDYHWQMHGLLVTGEPCAYERSGLVDMRPDCVLVACE